MRLVRDQSETEEKCSDARRDEHLNEGVPQYVERKRAGTTTQMGVLPQSP